MSSILDLAGRSILVTSPAGQAETLCGLIETNGGAVIRCPSVSILPPSEPLTLKRILGLIDAMDLLIFLSKNAVDYGFKALRDAGISLPLGIQVLAIGPTTKSALEDIGIEVAGVGSPPFNSERLLQAHQLVNRHGESIMIFQGEDGRTWLLERLIENGVKVFQALCYQRSAPSQIDPKVINYWETYGIDLITFSSVSAARNLWCLLSCRARRCLEQASIVVASSRIESGCRDIGYRGVIRVSDDPSQQSLVQTIRSHFVPG